MYKKPMLKQIESTVHLLGDNCFCILLGIGV